MVIAHAVFFKIALVHTGGHNEFVRRRYDAKVALRVRRVLDGDAPIAAVGLSPHDEHITAEVECRGRDALLFKLRAQKIRRVALGDAAEVELRAVQKRDRPAVRRFFERDLAAARMTQQFFELVCGRHAALILRKAPRVEHRGERRVERAVRRVRDRQRRFDQRR